MDTVGLASMKQIVGHADKAALALEVMLRAYVTNGLVNSGAEPPCKLKHCPGDLGGDSWLHPGAYLGACRLLSDQAEISKAP